MRYFSTFTGIGGFELGIEQAYEKRHLGTQSTDTESEQAELEVQQRWVGTTVEESDSVLHTNERRERPVCVGYSEVDKYAVQIFTKHYPTLTDYGDITKINAEELPDFDLFVGGFPCQAFSIAGLRRGFEDTRGTLFFDIARILREKQPRLLLLENVKGLLSHDQGRTFATIISTLDELGYDCQWQVLNSKNHGVPQNRERVFIVGHSRGTPRPQVFPFGKDDEVSADRQGQISPTITSRYYKQGQSDPYVVTGSTRDINQLNNPTHSNDRVYGTDGVSPTLNTMQGGRRQPFIKDTAIRRLTPLECERLQGFPDGWTEGVSDTQRYKTLGNAVTVNVVRDVMSRLINST